MTARLTAAMLVSALVRQAGIEGGFATVLARGDATAGAILLVTADRGVVTAAYERALDEAGRYRWRESRAAGEGFDDYLARRRRSDPDLWVVEVDSRDAEGLAARVFGDG